MTEQESKHPQLHAYMSNLLASGMRWEAVREHGYKMALAIIYDDAADAVRDGRAAMYEMTQACAMVQASEMLLTVCHDLGISVQAIKESIGRE